VAAIIQIESLDFAYGQRLVLKHLNLAVEEGSVLGVIGPNGGGKTTLIKLLLGLLGPTRGTVHVAGLDPVEATCRGDVIGYLPQNPKVAEGFPLSVRQLVRLALIGKTGLLRRCSADDLAFADRTLDLVGIAELGDQPIGQLSGGQLQRAFIARALAPRPKILILDEPTTGIDRSGQKQFVESIRQIKSELGLTVVLVTHDLRAVADLSDRVACLNVTLHYHDAPQSLPAELAAEWFGTTVFK
jgi:zinc transport system ATP-binding protein